MTRTDAGDVPEPDVVTPGMVVALGRPEPDVLVAGGGPVGLGTAIAAATAGLRVVLVEPRDSPVDKACGEGLLPGAVAALNRLGVAPRGMPLAGIRYSDGRRVAAATFRGGAGLGVRRLVLQQALVARAEEVGVVRLRGRVEYARQDHTHVHALLGGAGAPAGAALQARWLVAADGLHSPLRAALGLDQPVRGPARYGLRRHYRHQPWTDHVEVHWADDAEAYVTPVGPDLIGVAVLCPGGAPYDTWLERFPAVRERLAKAPAVTRVRGAGPLRRGASRRVRGRVLLAGDAAGYVDALTGEGVAMGLAAAQGLVACLIADRPQDYERTWRRATRRYRTTTEGLVWASSRPLLRAGIVPAAAGLPRVFRALVNTLA